MYIFTINLRAFLIFLLRLLFLQEVLFCVIIGINERAKLLWTPNKLLAPRSPEFTTARCRWPDLGIVYNSEKQNAKDHSTVSRYSITISSILIVKLNLHVKASVSPCFFLFYSFVNWSPLIKSELSFLNLLFRFLGFLFLGKYIKSWCRTIHFQYSPKKKFKIKKETPNAWQKFTTVFG